MSKGFCLSVIAVALASRVNATCDFQMLAAECIVPNNADTDLNSFCTAFSQYSTCVTQSDCVTQQSVQSVLSTPRADDCLGSDVVRPGANPKILTQNGDVKIAVAEGGAVCFQVGSDGTCLSDLVTGTALNESIMKPLDAITKELRKQAADSQQELDQLQSEMSTTISSMRSTQSQMKTDFASVNGDLIKQIGDLEDDLGQAVGAILDTADANSPFRIKLCGTPCKPGSKVSTNCDHEKSQKTECDQCKSKTFSTEYNSAECSNCSACSELTVKPCRPNSNAVCGECKSKCPIGEFLSQACDQKKTLPSICKKCTQCKFGEVQLVECTATSDTKCQAPYAGYGGGWMPFNWWRGKDGQKWPSDEFSVFGKEFGSCDFAKDQHCFGRLPPDLDEFQSQLLAMDKEDGTGNVYRWNFDPKNNIAHQVFSAMRDHQETISLKHKMAWPATVLRGKITKEKLDSMMFRRQNDVWSFILDDDTGYCNTALELGARLSGGGGTANFGVELYDEDCTFGTTAKSLFLYYRVAKTNSVPGAGVGWTKFWNFFPRQDTFPDMLGGKFGDCKFSKTSSKGVAYTPQSCLDKMPATLTMAKTRMLAIDWNNNVYMWDFSKGGNTATRMFESFTKGTTGRWAHGNTFNPRALAGTRTKLNQDSWVYEERCGIKSFSLDDDNCYCYTTLEVGRRLCGGGCTSTYGVDSLYDSHCQQVENNNKGLVFYFKEV